MLTRLSIKFMLLLVLLIIPTACNMTSDTDKSDDRPTVIPTSTVFNTQSALIATSTPLPTASAQPTNTPQPTSQQVVYQPCTIPAGWIQYRVVAGDTLSSLARRVGTTTDQLARGNCLSNPNNIEVGALIYTPRAVATVTPYATPACTLPPRLSGGVTGRVVPGSSNALRSQPGRGSNSVVIGEIPGGGVFNLLAGPQCADGYYWWQVNYNGTVGWTAEGQGSTYWLEPVTTTMCSPAPRLSSTIGAVGRVTAGLPNTLRSQPGRGSNSVALGEIPGGGVFNIVGGPQCADGSYWWQVNYNGVVGWTAEGQGSTYWLEPVTTILCSPAPRLSNTLGAVGRVTAGLPNTLRSQPGRGSNSVALGEIPGGSTFNILGGPQCADGSYWWQVNYNGTVGWTAEGQGSTYWLEPVTPTTCSPAPRLGDALNATGRVTPGLPNKLRGQPGLGSNSVVVGEIPGGGAFNIVGGPLCVDGSYWWQVVYNGVTGWTAEGQGSTYWLEPIMSSN